MRRPDQEGSNEWVSWAIVFLIIAGATLVAYFLGQWATGN